MAGGSLLESPANARKPLANAPVELSVDVFAVVVVVSVRVDRPNIVTTFAIAARTRAHRVGPSGPTASRGRADPRCRNRPNAHDSRARPRTRRDGTREHARRGREPSREDDEATVPALDAEDDASSCAGVLEMKVFTVYSVVVACFILYCMGKQSHDGISGTSEKPQ